MSEVSSTSIIDVCPKQAYENAERYRNEKEYQPL